MGPLSTRLRDHFRAWDKSTRLALAIALVLLLVSLLLALVGSPSLRVPALVGSVGLFIMAQIIVMWGNRTMLAPYSRAQRLYLRGHFVAARELLEQVRATGRPDPQALTLLGNTYRQLGQLEQSETVLREAVTLRPDYHFPLYGLGRTLIAQGRYPEAAEVIQAALTAGAPIIARFDLGEALYRDGEHSKAVIELREVKPFLEESYRILMASYLLYRLDAATPPPASLIQEGLPFWSASAERFANTPYGEAIRDDISALVLLRGR